MSFCSRGNLGVVDSRGILGLGCMSRTGYNFDGFCDSDGFFASVCVRGNELFDGGVVGSKGFSGIGDISSIGYNFDGFCNFDGISWIGDMSRSGYIFDGLSSLDGFFNSVCL